MELNRVRTFEADESVNLSGNQSVIWSEKLQLLHRQSILRRSRRRRGDHQRHVVTRVGAHDLVGTHRPVQPVHLAAAGVLNQHRRRLRRLAVPHI